MAADSDTTRNPVPERRYLTTLFADLVGYTALSERLDPELLREMQQQYQQLTRNIVERYGGFVAAYSGDGVLVYFGYPVAHENDAERGVRAALEVIAGVVKLDVSAGLAAPEALAARIALHTGLVVVGPEVASLGRSIQGAVGESVNIAARLQAEAEPNTVVVSGATRELIDGLFDFQPLGPRPIRGLSRPISVHRVLGPRVGGGRAVGHWQRGAVRLIGRQALMDRLVAQWQTVVREFGCRVVQVVGEAGLGKSRLVLELCETLALPEMHILKANCLEMFASTPLYAAAGPLWVRAGIRADDDESARRDKIVSFLSDRGLHNPDAVESLAGLLGLALGSAADGAQLPPAEVKRRQFALIISLIGRIVRVGPTLLWIEDTHWLDPSSVELLPHLIEELRETPLMIVLTRRSFPAGLELPEADDVVVLSPLQPAECFELARAVPGADDLPDHLLSEVVNLSDGIPLFIEQLVISLVAQARGPARASPRASTPSLPLTLAEMLSERLDRLPGGRRITQAAACIGRNFTQEFIAALLDEGANALEETLEALVRAEIFRRQGDNASTEFEFRHTLLRRVAYEFSPASRSPNLPHAHRCPVEERSGPGSGAT